MQLFFAFRDENEQWVLDEKEYHHARHVLRIKNNEKIFFTDGQGGLLEGIIRFHSSSAEIHQAVLLKQDSPPHPFVHLAIAPVKQFARMEWLLEKATECGVNQITFLITKRTEKKNYSGDRCKQIIRNACKQSMHLHVPLFTGSLHLHDFLEKHPPAEKTYCAAAHIHGKKQEGASLKGYEHIILLIGPEGDFTEEELTELTRHRYDLIALSRYRLRTETAGLYALINVRQGAGE